MRYLLVTMVLGLLGVPAAAAIFDTVPSALIGGPTDLRTDVRFVHLAPGVPAIDISLGHYPLAANLAYGQGTRYQTIFQQWYDVQARPTGAAITTPPLVSQPARFIAQFSYTMLLLGTPGALWLLQLGDDPGLPPVKKSRVRFVNAVLNSPPLTLDPVAGGALFPAMKYGAVTPYQEIPAPREPFRVTTRDSDKPLARIALPPAGSRVYTVVLYGDFKVPASLHSLLLIERVD